MFSQIYITSNEGATTDILNFPPKYPDWPSRLGNTDLINSDTRAEATPSVLHTHGRRSVALTADAA